ncbi:MAG TPA: NAD(P)-dependent alcohol dehydrogenase [Pyrinomonadaceae bacterium]|nr:NAD(P)-dependent alcohol dehydrogenase [Pyrinomonadaceae bacterium]
MKAIVYDQSSAGGLKCEEIEKPFPKDDEVLIKVVAASVNPLDCHLVKHPLLRRVLSKLGTIKSPGPGRDVAGIVEAVGGNTADFKTGDAVFGCCGGAFAEYARASESKLAMKPADISFEQAAALPIAGVSALQGLRDKAQIQPGQKILINGAAGGVGTFAVQVGKSLGADVTGVCSTRNLDMLRSIGADHVIDYTQQDFTQTGEHYDFLLDLVSNQPYSAIRRVLTPNGIYIGAGALGLSSMFGILTRKTSELVSALFTSQRFMSFTAKLTGEDLAILGEMVVAGKVKPVIDRRYNLSEALDAVQYVEKGHAQGKVVISVA